MAGVAIKPTARAEVPPVHREARARLNAALKPDPDLKRVGPDTSILFALIPLLLLPFAGAAVLALHPPLWPADTADWRQWLDPVCFAAAGLAVAGLFGWGCLRVVGRFAASRPETPQSAIREFYRAAQSHPARLQLLVRPQENPESPRPVFHWLVAGAVPSLREPKAVTKYWHGLLRGNPAVVRRIKILDLGLNTPRADVAVAALTLRVRSIRRARSQLAWLPALALAALPFALGPEFVRTAGAPFWAVVLGCWVVALGLHWLAFKAGGALAEARTIEVRKVLVRAGHNWRLLHGEWQAAAEEDLSWLE